MAHTIKKKAKLLNRVKRVRGQIEALEHAVEEEKDCTEVLHLVVTARGAMNSLMAEIIEDCQRRSKSTSTGRSKNASLLAGLV